MPQNVSSVQREEIWNMISIGMGEGIFRFNQAPNVFLFLTLARFAALCGRGKGEGVVFMPVFPRLASPR